MGIFRCFPLFLLIIIQFKFQFYCLTKNVQTPKLSTWWSISVHSATATQLVTGRLADDESLEESRRISTGSSLDPSMPPKPSDAFGVSVHQDLWRIIKMNISDLVSNSASEFGLFQALIRTCAILVFVANSALLVKLTIPIRAGDTVVKFRIRVSEIHFWPNCRDLKSLLSKESLPSSSNVFGLSSSSWLSICQFFHDLQEQRL